MTDQPPLPGDPQRAATALLTAIDADEPPFLLMLGSDAVTNVRVALDALSSDVDTWEQLSRTTDYDA